MEWFYALEGTQHGPVTREELQKRVREGVVSNEDFVWTQSMGEAWKKLEQVPELMQGAPLPTIPLPNASPLSPVTAAPEPEEEILFTGEISCTSPLGTGWEKMKDTLFRPFDLGKWFALGFTAWLATLSQQSGGGGGGGNIPTGNIGGTTGSPDNSPDLSAEQIGSFLQEAWDAVSPYMAIIIPVLILVIVFGLFILWVQCRGKFMFLDNIVNNRAEVKMPWARYSQHSRSLFLWSIGYSIACWIVFGACLAGIVFSILVPLAQQQAWSPTMLAPVVGFSILLTVLLIVNGYIMRFLEDFVVPIMYRFDMTTTEAWSKFRDMSGGHMGKLLLYGIFYGLIAAAWGIGLTLVGALACGIGCCLMALPYICAVYMLPMTTHLRHYSLDYLAQFAPEFRMQKDENPSVLP